MCPSWLKPYRGILVVGAVASLALVGETGLPIGEGTHLLLELVWVGVVIASLFVLMLQPALQQTTLPNQETPWINDELLDMDRIWLQFHPDENNPYEGWDTSKESI